MIVPTSTIVHVLKYTVPAVMKLVPMDVRTLKITVPPAATMDPASSATSAP
jgi:hypothetical protein